MNEQSKLITAWANWDGGTVKLTWDPEADPPSSLITSVHSFCFEEGRLLIVNLNHRGWDFPGGHIEEGETPLTALNRELMEEASIEGAHTLLGYIIVDHSENTKWNHSSPYPLIGYQAFYRTTLEKKHPFTGSHESSDRIFLPPSMAIDYCKGMLSIHHHILIKAIKY